MQASKELVDLQHTAKIGASSRAIGASVVVVQRSFEHVRRAGSAVAGSELVADKPQGYMAGDLRTPTEACYKVVEGMVRLEQAGTAHLEQVGTTHLEQAGTAHLVMEAKNMSA